MKCKKIKNLTHNSFVTCSFCKNKTADKQIVGHPFGGNTICKSCFLSLKKIMQAKDVELSLGEKQLYQMYKVY